MKSNNLQSYKYHDTRLFVVDIICQLMLYRIDYLKLQAQDTVRFIYLSRSNLSHDLI